MMRGSPPRFRIFVVFAALALSLVAGLQVVLRIGAARALDLGLDVGMAFAGVTGTGMILVLSLAAWLYCDERIAKPLERRGVTPTDAKGSAAVGQEDPAADEARRAARTMARLETEKAQLSRLLGEVPVAVLVINAADRIVLYDSQAAELLGRTGPARLNARIGEYLDKDSLADARKRLQRTGLEVRFTARPGIDGPRIDARLRPLEDGCALVILEDTGARQELTPAAPLVYDFDLMTPHGERPIAEIPLSALTFVVLSTDTTGLLPHRDDVVQIAAVRMVGARILRRESLELRIAPGLRETGTEQAARTERPGTKRPDILTASAQLYDFSRDAVIVAHNAPLRMAFLRRHDAATGLKWDHPQIDLVLLSALLFGDRADHSLRALAQRTGALLPPVHGQGGLAQALVAAEVLQRLLPMLAGREIDSLGPMMTALDRHARRLENLH